MPKSTTAECPAATNSPDPAPHRHGAAGAGTGAPRGLPPFLGAIIQGETTNFALLSASILGFLILKTKRPQSDPAESKEQRWDLGTAALMSAGKDEERCWPPSQDASPDTAALHFLHVTAGDRREVQGQRLTGVSGGVSRANLDSFKQNVPQDAN